MAAARSGLFLAPVCEDVAYEAALCRAYNDFMGAASQKSGSGCHTPRDSVTVDGGREKGVQKSPLRIISGMDRSMSAASPTRIFPMSFSGLGHTD